MTAMSFPPFPQKEKRNHSSQTEAWSTNQTAEYLTIALSTNNIPSSPDRSVHAVPPRSWLVEQKRTASQSSTRFPSRWNWHNMFPVFIYGLIGVLLLSFTIMCRTGVLTKFRPLNFRKYFLELNKIIIAAESDDVNRQSSASAYPTQSGTVINRTMLSQERVSSKWPLGDKSEAIWWYTIDLSRKVSSSIDIHSPTHNILTLLGHGICAEPITGICAVKSRGAFADTMDGERYENIFKSRLNDIILPCECHTVRLLVLLPKKKWCLVIISGDSYLISDGLLHGLYCMCYYSSYDE